MFVPQIIATFRDNVAQCIGQRTNEPFQVGILQRAPNILVGVLFERVQVETERAAEQDGVLRNYGQPGAEIVKADGGNVHIVQQDGAAGAFDQPEQRQCQGALTRAGSPDNSNLNDCKSNENHLWSDTVWTYYIWFNQSIKRTINRLTNQSIKQSIH